VRLLQGKGSRQSAFLLFIWQKKLIGTDTKADSTSGCFAMPRPLPAVSSFVQLRQWGLAKTNPDRSQHALFRASCVTRCAVTARPFAFVPDKRVRLWQGKGSRQSAFPDQLSKGTLRRKKLQADCHAPFLWFRLLRKFNSGGSQRRNRLMHANPKNLLLRDLLPSCQITIWDCYKAKGRGSLHVKTCLA